MRMPIGSANPGALLKSAEPHSPQNHFSRPSSGFQARSRSSPLLLADRLGLPTFEADGLRLYRRLTLIARRGCIERVFYPVRSPARHAAEVLEWLQRQSAQQ